LTEPRILIVSSKFGGGHYQAGEALAEGLRAVLSNNSQVRHCDYGSFFPKGTDFLMRTAYLKIVKNTPSIWGKIYKYTNTTHAEN
jgi:processive 1,2-diacylglycerol beta-glucosyltransferase